MTAIGADGRVPQPRMVAGLSRALTEGLTAQQRDAEFDAAPDESIASIFAPHP